MAGGEACMTKGRISEVGSPGGPLQKRPRVWNSVFFDVFCQFPGRGHFHRTYATVGEIPLPKTGISGYPAFRPNRPAFSRNAHLFGMVLLGGRNGS